MFANYYEIRKRINQIEMELKKIEGMDTEWPQSGRREN